MLRRLLAHLIFHIADGLAVWRLAGSKRTKLSSLAKTRFGAGSAVGIGIETALLVLDVTTPDFDAFVDLTALAGDTLK